MPLNFEIIYSVRFVVLAAIIAMLFVLALVAVVLWLSYRRKKDSGPACFFFAFGLLPHRPEATPDAARPADD
ncbi:unnamed protein product [Brassica oleracea var. botrytis]|uniref:(rape) hypothetical protein n=1 Tax=Brassica napus TaxID=3708 RepID=A0A816J5D4_BRANA|nr:unnamed protein product [Brassica napus]